MFISMLWSFFCLFGFFLLSYSNKILCKLCQQLEMLKTPFHILLLFFFYPFFPEAIDCNGHRLLSFCSLTKWRFWVLSVCRWFGVLLESEGEKCPEVQKMFSGYIPEVTWRLKVIVSRWEQLWNTTLVHIIPTIHIIVLCTWSTFKPPFSGSCPPSPSTQPQENGVSGGWGGGICLVFTPFAPPPPTTPGLLAPVRKVPLIPDIIMS